MRRNAFLAFDEFVPDNSNTYYTTQELNARLGATDQIAVHTVVDNVTGGAPPTTVTVTLDHSGDDRLWVPKLTLLGPVAWTSNGVSGSDPGTSPTLAFVRIGVKLNNGSAPNGAHVRVHVTQRDQG